ncbi:Protein CBG19297 [Caenorhabditis briggsae]|uniref:Protein CBG19297 n=1 Tax=Caenorhabditis briggsae TaxID=6238 RepID=A8XVA5_CAEBR|nr:Protein CBG19297 [Caenorhabditis briggsae]CAP36572.2 Protein CBG19297 [Caenorhabditis briggsae]
MHITDLMAAEGHFRVHLVRDSENLNVQLEEGSKLAAYYNSLFWHEISTAEKISIASGQFYRRFRVSDGDIKHSVFVTKSEKRGSARSRLTLPELERVAREIATLHAANSRLARCALDVEENYGNIKMYRKKIQREVIEILESAVTQELARYFVNPASIPQKIGILTHHLETHKKEDDEENHQHKVITHGRLSGDTCRFDEDGKLVEITEWENIHLGNPVEDLTNLLVTSADVDIRRKKFMKVFQVYFYTLVDTHPPNFQLPDLKRWFKEFEAKAVMNGIESLLLTLADSPDENLKREAAHRWETSLDDSVDFLTGNYISDHEHTFFSHKDEDED